MKTDISKSVAKAPGPSADQEALERNRARKAIALRYGETDPLWAQELLKMAGLVDDHLRPI
jgi:hypothetical protein